MSLQVGFKLRKRRCLPYGVWKLVPQIWCYRTKRSASVSLKLEMRNLKQFVIKRTQSSGWFISLLCLPNGISEKHLLGISNYVFFSDYARSKLCVSMAVQSGCVIGDLMEDDLYNPFCIDGIDPLGIPSSPGEFFQLYSQNVAVVYPQAVPFMNFNFWRLKCFCCVYHFVVAPLKHKRHFSSSLVFHLIELYWPILHSMGFWGFFKYVFKGILCCYM